MNKDTIVRELLEVAIAVPLLILGAICIILFDSLSVLYVVCIVFILVVILFLIYAAFIKDRMPDRTGHVMTEAKDGSTLIRIRCTKYISSRKPLHIEVDGKIVASIYRGNDLTVPLCVGRSDILVYPTPIDVGPLSFDVTPGTSFFIWETESGTNHIIDNDGASMEPSLEKRYTSSKKKQKQIASVYILIGSAVIVFIAYLMVTG